MSRLDRCYNIEDMRSVAKARLPRGIFDHVDKGTEDGISLAENRAAFERIKLRPKYMVDLRDVDLSTEVFGQRISLPFAIAPTGSAGLCWPQGELALAQAAAKAGIPFCLATASLTSMETIATAGGRLWFQLYLWSEMELSYQIASKALDLGYEALIVTIDGGLGRVREHNDRNGFSFPFQPNFRAFWDMGTHPHWLVRVLFRTLLTSGMLKNENYPPQYQRMIAFKAAPKPKSNIAMTWADVAKLREFWPKKLIVKSILSVGDAVQAVDAGADAIIVSNHGGRAMDSALPTISVLADIVAAVGDRTTVMLDSGIRRGSDIAKAIGLGAKMCLVGRPALYGITCGGTAGAAKTISILATELEKTMGGLGSRTIAELNHEIFARLGTD